jgi:hypothetical protein
VPDDTNERNWVVLYVARSLGYFGFGSTPEVAFTKYREAGGVLEPGSRSFVRMTKVTHPEGTTPLIEGDTGSIQFPEGQDGRGTTYEDLRLTNGLWIALP